MKTLNDPLFDKNSVKLSNEKISKVVGGIETLLDMPNYTATACPRTPGCPQGQQFDGWDPS